VATTLEPLGSATTDELDVELARSGDREAFDRLVKRHEGRVLDAARAILRNEDDALDVSQEAFLRAFRAIARFRAEASFGTWIIGITRNAARSLLARRGAKKRGNGAVLSSISSLTQDSISAGPSSPEAHEILARRELVDAFHEAMGTLEPDDYEIVWRRDVAGEAYQAIAASLGLASGTLKSKLHRARSRLRRELTRWA